MWHAPNLQRSHLLLPNWIIKIHYNLFTMILSTPIYMMMQPLPQHHLTFFASWSAQILYHEHC